MGNNKKIERATRTRASSGALSKETLSTGVKSHNSTPKDSFNQKTLLLFVRRRPVLSSTIVIIIASLIFGLRNTSAFTAPNFYAEDATVLFQHVYTQNILATLLSAFNGYLIVGLYSLAYVAAGINLFFGGGVDSLPVVTGAVSCVFFGFAASLPFVLFRRHLGVGLSSLAVLFTALVPIKSYDYAILGTLSNTKFVFLYIACLFVIYRIVNPRQKMWRVFLVDAVLLLCALTNATVAFIIPMILLPYLVDAVRAYKTQTLSDFRITPAMISGVTLTLLGVVYTLVAVAEGIPKIPGYLDGPFKMEAALPIIDRSLFYALTYPITAVQNSYFVVALFVVALAVLVIAFVRRKHDRLVILTASWAIFVGTALFVINRPGVGDLYLNYLHKGGADQFFMAQNMIFIFLGAWLIRERVKSWDTKKITLSAVVLALYFLLAIPHGSSFGNNAKVYSETIRTIDQNLQKVCSEHTHQDSVDVQVYPSVGWQWHVKRSLACDQ